MAKTRKRMQAEDEEYVLEFEVMRTEGEAVRPYGIRARLRNADGGVVDEASAGARFFTEAEAEAAMEVLARHEVTPCTLCDVL